MSWYVTAKERNDMRRMRAAGMTLRAINALYPKRATMTIHKHIRDVPVPPNRARTHRRCDPVAALRLREQGLTFRAIATKFGVSATAVFMACQRYLEKQEAQA
jgi:DNA invertase Pin-like site-specific DNA recombinase